MSIAINDNFERDQLVASFTGQMVFTYSFPIFSDTYLTVYQYGATEVPDDPTQRLTLGTDYTVQGVGQAAGGTITLVVGATIGDIITIVGTQPIDRQSVFPDLNPFTVALNQQLNQMTVMLQQVFTYWANMTPHYNYDELVSTYTEVVSGVRPFKLILPMLPDGHVWVGRGQLGSVPDDIITALLPTSGGGGGSTTQEIVQAGQTFIKGQWVRIDVPTGIYMLAQSNNVANAERAGIVIASNTATGAFTVQQSGYISTIQEVVSGFQAGVPQFLSPTVPGGTQPSDVFVEGQVSLPCFLPDSPTSGWVVPYRGFIANGSGNTGSGSGSGNVFLGYLNDANGFSDENILQGFNVYQLYFVGIFTISGASASAFGLQTYISGTWGAGNYSHYTEGVSSIAGPNTATFFGVVGNDTPNIVNYLTLFPSISNDFFWGNANGVLINNGNATSFSYNADVTDSSPSPVVGYAFNGSDGGGGSAPATGLRLFVDGPGTLTSTGYVAIFGVPNA